MDLVELTMALEEEFGITISDEEAEKMATPRQVVDYFVARGAGGWLREHVASRVREITIEQLGIKPDQYHEDARFIEDFGAG